MTLGRLPRLAAILAVALAAGPARADGEYFGLDLSNTTLSEVLSVTRGQLTYGADYTDYGDGESAGLSLTRVLPFDLGVEGLQVAVGPSLGFSGGDLSELRLGGVLSAQRWRPTEFGNYFLQASYNTIDGSYFTQAQLGFAEPGLTLSLARGASELYAETSVSLSKRIGESPLSVHAGYRFVTEEWFVGFSVSTF